MKLLAPKPFSQFDSEEYFTYIKSLYADVRKKSAAKKQSDYKVTVRRKKDGTLSLVTKRNPLYVTPIELNSISLKTGIAENELFMAFKERNYIVAEHTEIETMQQNITDIPF